MTDWIDKTILLEAYNTTYDINMCKIFLEDNYINIINNCTSYEIDSIIYNYLNKINLIDYSYKNVNTYEYLYILHKYIQQQPHINSISNNVIISIITNINACMHGQKILLLINESIKKLSNEDITYIIKEGAFKWTYPIYLYYVNNYHIDDNIKTNIIRTAFTNTDDRIYKHIVNKGDIVLSNHMITDIVISLTQSNNIPHKYILKRLKYLNKIVPNLNEYFDIMYDNLCRYTHIDTIPYIVKYYNMDNLNSKSIKLFVNNIFQITEDEYHMYTYNIYNTYYNILNSTQQNILVIYMILKYGNAYNKTLHSINDDIFREIKPILTELFVKLFNKYTLSLPFTTDFYNMLNSFTKEQISSCITFDKYIPFYFLPYIYYNNNNNNNSNSKKINIVINAISKYIKMIKMKKTMLQKIKIYPILNEMKNLKPNTKKPILKNGTNFYIQSNQTFNMLPPYHIYPGQLQTFDVNMKFLLKEKADGVLTTTLPLMFNFDCKVKAEYIEELDLYMVFDIDDKYMDICERHLFFHKMHKYGQLCIPTIDNLEIDNLKIDNLEIEKERIKLKEFLNEPYENYRWYPKPAWIIQSIVPFIKPLTDIINNIYSFDEIIPCDGFILTPLNGMREIKIKPKKLHTIDLLYRDKKWYDMDGYIWDIVKYNPCHTYMKNSIWRCYPSNDTYEPREIRYDKTKPNTNAIVKTIINIYKSEFLYEYDTIYHNTDTSNSEWNKIKTNNNIILQKMCNKIINMSSSKKLINILDCGCGSGRTLKYLKQSNYKYTGIDIDTLMIAKGININNELDNVQFYNYNLNQGLDIKSRIINQELYYDIILSINSIMHFSSDKFWEDLSKVTKQNTIMLVNIVDITNSKYTFGEYFIESIDNIIYYQFPIHTSIKQEPYIDIIKYFNKYNWNIVDTFKPNNNDLTDCYKWFIVIKN